jgi:hypothetical protein
MRVVFGILSIMLFTIHAWGATILPSWMEEQIQRDFSIFARQGITEDMNDASMDWSAKFWDELEDAPPFYRVKVIDSKTYVFNRSGKLVKVPVISYFLDKILQEKPLPDLDFVYLFAATPNPKAKDGTSPCGPLLSGNKIDEYPYTILYHDRMTAVGWSTSDYLWTKAASETESAVENSPWDEKKSILYWRGQISDYKKGKWKSWYEGSKRGMLYLMSLKHSSFMDVGITGFVMLDKYKIPYDPSIKVQMQPIANHIPYKYQVVVDGYSATNPGYAWRLLSNCTVLKVDSPIRQWFYAGLQPWVHYVPIEADLSNLVSVIQYALSHDNQMREIAYTGRTFAQTYLLDPEPQVRYCRRVLECYAALQQYQPLLREYEKLQIPAYSPYVSLISLLPFNPHGWFSSENANALSYLIKKYKCRTIVELGSWLGKSTRFIAKLLDSEGIVYAVDHWLGSDEHHREDRKDVSDILPVLYEQFLSNVIHEKLEDKIVPLKMTTTEAAKILKVRPDLVYVDASHDEKSVLSDLSTWYPLLNDSGILCGDDWTWAQQGVYPVREAVKKFAKKNALEIETNGPFWLLKKDKKKILPL